MGIFSAEHTAYYAGHEIVLYGGFNSPALKSVCLKLYVDSKCVDERLLPSFTLTKEHVLRGQLTLNDGRAVPVRGVYTIKMLGRNIAQIEVNGKVVLHEKGAFF